MSFGIRHLFLFILLTALCLPTRGAAQYEGCIDVRGMAVYSQVAPGLPDVAMAALVPPNPAGQPVIYYNPAVLANFSPITRRWWYMHECGHHALAHAFRNIPLDQEQEADCFAVVTLVRGGEFTDLEVRQVQSELSQLGPGDWQHLPGPARAVNLDACLRSAGVSINDDSGDDGLAPHWEGEWEGDDGYRYLFTIHLTTAGNTLRGTIDWTLDDAPPGSEVEDREGDSAIEFVRGTFNPATRVLELTGYRVSDPSLIGQDSYRLRLSPNGQSFSGVSRGNSGTWSSRMEGVVP